MHRYIHDHIWCLQIEIHHVAFDITELFLSPI